MTVREALSYGHRLLQNRGSESPYLDCVLLLGHAMGVSKEHLFARLTETISVPDEHRFHEYLAAREAGTPVAYLTGSKEFYGRSFRVDERGLIPRPDTETVVETALTLLPSTSTLSVHDCCTGSGCIAITLAAERPGWTVSASDLDVAALSLFRENSRDILGTELPHYRSDLLTTVPGSFSLITANPPYVPEPEIARMTHVRPLQDKPSGAGGYPLSSGSPTPGKGDPSAAQHMEHAAVGTSEGRRDRLEPVEALAAGTDGLAVLRALVPEAFSKLKKRGYFVTEIGHDQAGSVRELFSKAGFTDIETREDLEGRSRVCYGRR